MVKKKHMLALTVLLALSCSSINLSSASVEADFDATSNPDESDSTHIVESHVRLDQRDNAEPIIYQPRNSLRENDASNSPTFVHNTKQEIISDMNSYETKSETSDHLNTHHQFQTRLAIPPMNEELKRLPRASLNIETADRLHLSCDEEIVMQQEELKIKSGETTSEAIKEDNESFQGNETRSFNKESCFRGNGRRTTRDRDEFSKNGKDESFEEDDRTLLDIFGEVSKEFLTQKVIKETDPRCVWNWKSLRCEPSRHCSFQYKLGDYHLGRSCRLRKRRRHIKGNRTRISNLQNTADKFTLLCNDNLKVAASFREISIEKRISSLVMQTGEIIQDKVQRLLIDLKTFLVRKKEAIKQKFESMRQDTCRELWANTAALQNVESQQNADPNFCFAIDLVPIPTIQERVLCGPTPEFPICDYDEFDDEYENDEFSNLQEA